MHYRNGREAKNGDKMVKLEINSGKIVAFGVLHSATPGNDYCNGNIAIVQSMNEGACMVDCLHIDDVAEILAEKNFGKRPEAQVEKQEEVKTETTESAEPANAPAEPAGESFTEAPQNSQENTEDHTIAEGDPAGEGNPAQTV